MFFLESFVLVMVVGILLLVGTQVIVPLFSGEPMFPLFRKSAVKAELSKAEKELEMLAEATRLKQVAKEIDRRKAELDKK